MKSATSKEEGILGMPRGPIDKVSFTSQLKPEPDDSSSDLSDPPTGLLDNDSLLINEEDSSSDLSDPPEGLLEGMSSVANIAWL